MTERLRAAFSVFYLAIAVFLITRILSSGFCLFSIIGIGVFRNALWVTFFRWILKHGRLKNNYDVMANQKITIVEKAIGKILRSKKLNEIHEMNAEMNTKYLGNIIFGEPENIFGKNEENFSFFRRRGVCFTEDKHTFLSVKNIN